MSINLWLEHSRFDSIPYIFVFVWSPEGQVSSEILKQRQQSWPNSDGYFSCFISQTNKSQIQISPLLILDQKHCYPSTCQLVYAWNEALGCWLSQISPERVSIQDVWNAYWIMLFGLSVFLLTTLEIWLSMHFHNRITCFNCTTVLLASYFCYCYYYYSCFSLLNLFSFSYRDGIFVCFVPIFCLNM